MAITDPEKRIKEARILKLLEEEPRTPGYISEIEGFTEGLVDKYVERLEDEGYIRKTGSVYPEYEIADLEEVKEDYGEELKWVEI